VRKSQVDDTNSGRTAILNSSFLNSRDDHSVQALNVKPTRHGVDVEFYSPLSPWNDKGLKPQNTIEGMPLDVKVATAAFQGRSSKVSTAASSQLDRRKAFAGVEHAGPPPLPPHFDWSDDEEDSKLSKAIEAIPLEGRAATAQGQRSKVSTKTAASAQPRLAQA
jgi:hypothetical protein